MTDTEFNLSDKIQSVRGRWNMSSEDVKEFIKRLKDYLITSAGNSKLLKEDRKLVFNWIDKLAGDRLK